MPTIQEILDDLSNENNIELKTIVAKNPTTHPDTLSRLANECDKTDVRVAIAQNRNTPTNILTELLNKTQRDGTGHHVVNIIAENPNTSPETLTYIKNLNRYQFHLAKNLNTPIEILHELGKEEVRIETLKALLENTTVQNDYEYFIEILEKLISELNRRRILTDEETRKWLERWHKKG